MRHTTVAAALVVLACLLACGGGRPAGTKGRYPSPTTRHDGKTADEWARLAEDNHITNCEQGCRALRALGKEGVPFLLTAAESHRDRPRFIVECLTAVKSELVADEDLSRIAAFLDERYSSSDRAPMSVRGEAIANLGFAGPRAGPFAPQIHALAGTRGLEKPCAVALQKIER